MLYQKEIPVRDEVDIFVAGGGPAGIAAALAASRAGKRVFLAEASGAFGGLATTGMVPAFATFGDGVRLLCRGIGEEIRRQVSVDVPLMARWTPIHAEELKRVLDAMMEASTVRYALFTQVIDVIAQDRSMTATILHGKEELFAVKAKVFIDCTGDGTLCALGGGRWVMGDESGRVMPATLCSQWADIQGDRIDGRQDACIEQAHRDGVLSQADRHLPGIQLRKDGSGGGNVGHVFDVDPLDTASLTQGMIAGRKSLAEYEQYYRRYRPGFEEVKLIATADMLGIRESRRIVCDYMLSLDDFLARENFDDEIGRYCYPVDIHVKSTEPEELERFEREYRSLRYQAGESYGIPYRCLIPVSFDNVLVAGRCLGADRQMQASLRVMPGCFITGQAAGTAAALAVTEGGNGQVRAVSYAALADALTAAGAVL